MSADDVTRRLEEVLREKAGQRSEDKSLDKISRIFKTTAPEDQMVTLVAYMSALTLEIADYNQDAATHIWQTAWGLSAQMMQDLYDAETAKKETLPRVH